MKFLIIRFSSFGDVTQALSIATKIAHKFSSHEAAEIHWAVREDLAPLLEGHPHIHKIWRLNRKTGLKGLLQLIADLRKEKFTHIYDAHNNLRSQLISLLLRPPLAIDRLISPPQFIRKSQFRWKRFLLFKLRIDTYKKPRSGQRDLLEPLAPWGIDNLLPEPPQLSISPPAEKKVKEILESQQQASNFNLQSFYCLAPSSAFELKRWPLEYFMKLIELKVQKSFVCLGGPEDTFIEKLSAKFPDRVVNLAGQLSLQESAAAISMSRGLISNDTGLLHVAEQLGKSCVALMGPAPFGFPSRATTNILERNLPCRPCSKHGQGPCVNEIFQRCLRDIQPEEVAEVLKKWPS